MPATLLTPPTAEPLTADEAATMARLDGGAHWTPILELAITAARQVAEHETGRKLMQQTWRHTLPAFPVEPIPEPLPTAVAVSYRNQAGAWVTLDGAAYAWAADDGGLWLYPATSWPASYPDVTGIAVRVDVTSGAATAAAVPAAARQFIAAMVTVMAHDPSLTTTEVLGANAYLLRLLDPLRLYP
jgi:uncharacterized phiE125 gp8 family phage protein